MGLDMQQRRALTEEIAQRYRAAPKREKSKILDEFTAATGYHRKYASHLLTHWGTTRLVQGGGGTVEVKVAHGAQLPERRGRPRTYDTEVVEGLEKVWAAFGMMCGKYLAAAIRTHMHEPAFLAGLALSTRVREKLQLMSPATIDRLLAGARSRLKPYGISHTRPAHGAILAQVPIRTFTEHPAEPGYFQADLVGHDGGEASGEFCYTLTATDPATGWSEPRAVPNKAGKWTVEALDWISLQVPVPVYGWHTDNGSEFLNGHMMRYCRARDIYLSRSRFHKKNDNCYVEQKNDAVVRRWVGYLRYEGEQHCRLLNELYDTLRLLVNFFYPQRKLIEKQRVGSSVRKRYDTPRTPYQRVLESEVIDKETKSALRAQMAELDLLELQRRLNACSQRLLSAVERNHSPTLLERPSDGPRE
jgi:hypothetical protein